MTVHDLAALGWDDSFAEALSALDRPRAQAGRVARLETAVVTLWTASGDVEAQLPARLKAPEDRPAAGDWVAFQPGPPKAKVITILPRRTLFERRAAGRKTQRQVVAANVDVVFVVSGLDGDFSPRRLERYLAAIAHSGARPVVLLTKAGLANDRERSLEEAQAAAGNASVHLIDVVAGFQADVANQYLHPGVTAALVGSSGVGKSTLLNHWAGEARQEVRKVRERDARGQHTTTHRELFVLRDGALVIDTPGMRELALWGNTRAVDDAFPDVERLASTCRFSNCRHASEPGCVVQEALETGELESARYESYRSLRAEIEATAAEVDAQRRRAENKMSRVARRSGPRRGR